MYTVPSFTFFQGTFNKLFNNTHVDRLYRLDSLVIDV